MAGHNPSSISEPTTTNLEESAAHTERLQEQLRSSERLTEYYNQVVAELRASLERIEADDHQPS
jgi:hypothetical protein